MFDGLQTFDSQGYPIAEVHPSLIDDASMQRQDQDTTVFSTELKGVVRVEAGEDCILIEIPDAHPDWFERALEAIVELLNLPENWDSYGARRVSLESAIAAIHVIGTSAPQMPQPAIVPTAQGGIQLEWHQNGVDLEVRTKGRDTVSVYHERHGSENNFECQVSDLSHLLTLLSDITPG